MSPEIRTASGADAARIVEELVQRVRLDEAQMDVGAPDERHGDSL